MDKKRALCGGCWFLANVLALVSVPMALEAAVLAGGNEWSLQSWALLFGGRRGPRADGGARRRRVPSGARPVNQRVRSRSGAVREAKADVRAAIRDRRIVVNHEDDGSRLPSLFLPSSRSLPLLPARF